MSDHYRQPSCAHLHPRIQMNTRRHAHGVRYWAKPSMTISAELKKTFENLVNQVLNLDHIPVEPLAFCTRLKAHKKSSRSCMERR
jgi:hypothetical protein